jgi:polyisoprenoid-binding protein YceI
MRSEWWARGQRGRTAIRSPLFFPGSGRRRRRFPIVLAGSIAALALSACAGASTWALDPTATHVEFSVRNLSVAYVHGGFHLASGTVQLNDEDVSRSTIEAVIDATSIDTDEPKRDAHLRSADFLDVGRYPTVAFRSTQIERTGDDRWTVTGQLTLRGTTREVVLNVQGATINGDRASAHASTTIERRDFGITYSGFAVGKDVAIAIDAIGRKAPADAPPK